MVIKDPRPARPISLDKLFGFLVRADPANEGVAWGYASGRMGATATAFAFAVEGGVAIGVLEVFDVPSKTRPARAIRRIIPAQSSGGAT